MGSRNHAFVQTNLIVALSLLDRFTVFTELSIEIDGKEYKPDVCIYPKQNIKLPAPDILRVQEMPLLAIEILSPKQNVQIIFDKFQAYFAAQIPSCWLVIPLARTVIIYLNLMETQAFTTGDIVDSTLNIQLPSHRIFG